MFQGVEAGRGFAFGGARAGAVLGVAAIGFDLFFGRHAKRYNAVLRRDGRVEREVVERKRVVGREGV